MRARRKLPLGDLGRVLLSEPDVGSQFDWELIYGNAHPVHVEVGSGKGAFIVESAQRMPERNFLGIEVMGPNARYAASRLERAGLRNARIIKADAGKLFRSGIPPGSVSGIHIFFPDPWWKKRHHKRRVMTPAFVADCRRALRSGGLIDLATDVEETFALGLGCLGRAAGLEVLGSEDSAARIERPVTNFERKARDKGRQVFEVSFRAID